MLNEDLVEAIEREEIRVSHLSFDEPGQLILLILQAALRDPKKISRERVGIELEKMLLGEFRLSHASKARR